MEAERLNHWKVLDEVIDRYSSAAMSPPDDHNLITCYLDAANLI